MALDRISTYALHQNTLRDTGQAQLRLAELQIQISSGFKSQDFAGLASQAEQFLSLETKITKAGTYLVNNKLIATRIEITNTALEQVIDTATDLKNLILQRRSDAAGVTSEVFQQQLESYWQSMVQALNTNVEGRYLFSGDRTDVPAVDADTFPLLLNSGTPDTGYYTGGNQDLTLQADDNIVMNYNVRADAPGFQKIFAGLSMAKAGDQSNSDAELQAAYDLVQEGLDDTIALQATVNANKIAIDDVNLRHQALQLYWTGVKEEIINTDLVAASTQVAINQGILQASFQAFAQINSLRLANFLQ